MSATITLEPSTADPFAEYNEWVNSLDDNETWCLERQDNTYLGLCGSKLGEKWIPNSEIPDERLCPECERTRDGRNP